MTKIKVTEPTGQDRIDWLNGLIDRNADYLSQDRFDEQGRISMREQIKKWQTERDAIVKEMEAAS